MIVVTYIYHENERTRQTIESFKRFGYEVAIVRVDTHRGNGEAMRHLYECFKRASTGHENFIYADAADSYCQRPFEVPCGKIIYSTEKACYPHVHMAANYPPSVLDHKSPWKFLNGGGYGGSLRLMIEFMERYGLNTYPGDVNGQHEQMVAYLHAHRDNFPIELDLDCNLFQTMAFADPSEFYITHMADDPTKEKDYISVLKNKVTNKVPAILHFNGCTDMAILKELK